MQQIKLKWSNMEVIKELYSAMVDTYEEGAVFVVTDMEKVIYKKASEKFDIPKLLVGNKTGKLADTVYKRKQILELNLGVHVYGVRVKFVAGPFWSDDETEVLGGWALILPRVHKMVGAFDTFAPIITEMLPEGGFMYLADKEKFVKKQGSSKFDIPMFETGVPLKDSDLATECILSKSKVVREFSKDTYGVITQVSCYPLFDNNKQEVVGAFGLALPRELPLRLKGMADNLGKGLSEVSAAMEEMAAAASEVANNQGNLHQEIGKVSDDAKEINNVLSFIKEIADETKMLGLNAAIEAARAGEAGRGFGVVAEEIRKLSDQSKQTVVQIKELLDRVNNSINKTIAHSDATLENTQQVAAAAEEVNASLEEMAALSQQLEITANQL